MSAADDRLPAWVDAIGMGFLLAWATWRVLAAAPSSIAFGIDEDAIWMGAQAIVDQGPGAQVYSLVDHLGTRLGWIYPATIAALSSWIGPDPLPVWHGLLLVDLLTLAAGAWALRRAAGSAPAWLVLTLVAVDPLRVDMNHLRPLWYQHHDLGLVLLSLAGMIGWVRTGSGAWLALGGGAVGLAVQVHAAAWALIPTFVGATLARARRMQLADVAVAWLLFACLAWPILAQAPEIVAGATSPGTPPARHGAGAVGRALMSLADRSGLGIVGLGLAGAAAVEAARRGTSGGAPRAMVIVATWWLGTALALAWRVGPVWDPRYAFEVLLAVGLLLGAVVEGTPRGWPRAAGLTVFVGVMLALAPARSRAPAPESGWRTWDAVRAAVDAIVAGGGVSDDPAATLRHAHAWPFAAECRLAPDGPCGVRWAVGVAAKAAHADTRPRHLNLWLRGDGRIDAEPWAPCDGHDEFVPGILAPRCPDHAPRWVYARIAGDARASGAPPGWSHVGSQRTPWSNVPVTSLRTERPLAGAELDAAVQRLAQLPLYDLFVSSEETLADAIAPP